MAARDRIDLKTPRIQRLIESGVADAVICRQEGIAPATLRLIRRGGRPTADNVGRCSGCGNRVVLPCRQCAEVNKLAGNSVMRERPPVPRHPRFTSRPLAKVFSFVLLLCAALPCWAESIDCRPELVNIRVTDGDTLTADVVLPYDVVLRDQSIRVADYDAWESRRIRRTVKITDEELVRGKAAAEALRELVAPPHRVRLQPAAGRDPYGRRLGTLRVVTDDTEIDVGAWMRARGHLRREE